MPADFARKRERVTKLHAAPLLPWIGTSVSVGQCAQPWLAHRWPLHGLAWL